MNPIMILAIIAILACFASMVFVARSQVPGRKGVLLLSLAIIQLSFSIIAGQLIPSGTIASLTEGVIIVPAFIMLGFSIREMILLHRESAKSR